VASLKHKKPDAPLNQKPMELFDERDGWEEQVRERCCITTLPSAYCDGQDGIDFIRARVRDA